MTLDAMKAELTAFRKKMFGGQFVSHFDNCQIAEALAAAIEEIDECYQEIKDCHIEQNILKECLKELRRENKGLNKDLRIANHIVHAHD